LVSQLLWWKQKGYLTKQASIEIVDPCRVLSFLSSCFSYIISYKLRKIFIINLFLVFLFLK